MNQSKINAQKFLMKVTILIGIMLMILSVIIAQEGSITGNTLVKHSIVMSVTIPEEYRSVESKEDIIFQVHLRQLGDFPQLRDIILHSYLKDTSGNRFELGSETLAIQTQASTIVVRRVPELDTKKYTLVVEAKSVDEENILGEASYEITVDEEIKLSPQDKNERYLTNLFIIGAIITGINSVMLIHIIRTTNKKKEKN